MKKRGFLILLGIASLCLQPMRADTKGQFEFSLHYGTWSIDLLRGAFEEGVGSALEDSLRSQFLEAIREDHPDYYERSYHQSVDFDSSGHNYGFEARWFPGGLHGGFSLGLAIEKTAMKVGFRTIEAHMELGSSTTPTDTILFDTAVYDAAIEIKPLSFHFNIALDIKPSWRVHPFLVFGAGIFSISYLEEGRLHFTYSGSLKEPGEPVEAEAGVIDRTIRQLFEEGEGDEESGLPGILPFVQLQAGVRGRISDMVHLTLSAGIWNGFSIRGGVAIRL